MTGLERHLLHRPPFTQPGFGEQVTVHPLHHLGAAVSHQVGDLKGVQPLLDEQRGERMTEGVGRDAVQPERFAEYRRHGEWFALPDSWYREVVDFRDGTPRDGLGHRVWQIGWHA